MIPDKQKIYKEVYQRACEELIRSDYEQKARKAGLVIRKSGADSEIPFPFFNENISLALPDITFKSTKGANVTLVTKIILLHYINRATGEELTGEKISYVDIPGLSHYEPVFTKRAILPLVRAFGYDPDAFKESMYALGGQAEEYGDVSGTVYALPRVPITFILWKGDEEFPPTVKALYDRVVPSYLPLEDIAVITKLAASRILKEARRIYSEEDL